MYLASASREEKRKAQIERRRRNAPQPITPGCGMYHCNTSFPAAIQDILTPCDCAKMRIEAKRAAAQRPYVHGQSSGSTAHHGAASSSRPGATYRSAQYTYYPRPPSAAAGEPYYPPPPPHRPRTSSNAAGVPPRSDDRIDVPPKHPPETRVQPRSADPPPAASNGHRRDVAPPNSRKSRHAPNSAPKAIPIPPTPLPIHSNGSIDTRTLVAVEEREYRRGKFGVYTPGR